jgi:hypothetical protein
MCQTTSIGTHSMDSGNWADNASIDTLLFIQMSSGPNRAGEPEEC